MLPFLLFGAGVAAGLGVAALAPGLMPQVTRSARPLAKEALKAAITGYAQFRLAAAEAAEAASDLMAEVSHEMASAAPAEDAPIPQAGPVSPEIGRAHV